MEGIGWIYKGGLGDEIPKKGKYQFFHIEIGIGDPITPAAISLKTEYLLGSGDLSWKVYPPETILAEKLHTLVARGSENSRSKDIYDVYIFLPQVNRETLLVFFSRNCPSSMVPFSQVRYSFVLVL